MEKFDLLIGSKRKKEGLTLEQAQREWKKTCEKNPNALVGVVSQSSGSLIFSSAVGGLTYFGKQLALKN